MTSFPMSSAENMGTLGIRFNPTNEELIGYYLLHKICGNDNLVSAIAVIDYICNYEPWDLPWLAAIPSEDTWYFFSRPDRKNSKSGTIKRVTKAGFWKVTGKERPINGQVTGFKRVLVFYRGRVSNPEWTNWTIHEFYLKSSDPNGEDYVISRLHRKPLKKTVNSMVDEGEPGHDSASEVDNPLSDISFPVMDLNPLFTAELNDSNGQQPVMHESQRPSYVNPQHTNGVTDDYTRSLSQLDTTAQQDKILEGKSHPAIQDAHSYSGSMQIPLSDSSPSESSGSQPVEDNSDIEAVNTLWDCFDAVGNDLLQDWFFEHAPAYFS